LGDLLKTNTDVSVDSDNSGDFVRSYKR